LENCLPQPILIIIIIDITVLLQYQVIRGNELNASNGLAGLAESVKANFMELPFAENSFDGVYAIEATCHAPVREGVYSQIFKVLKPGQIFACYEWCLTPKYDKDNELHRLIKKKIEEGDGLPDMATEEECVKALRSVGFEVYLLLLITIFYLPFFYHLICFSLEKVILIRFQNKIFIDRFWKRATWRLTILLAEILGGCHCTHLTTLSPFASR
jgi:SAM-dependent methyltransferase